MASKTLIQQVRELCTLIKALVENKTAMIGIMITEEIKFEETLLWTVFSEIKLPTGGPWINYSLYRIPLDKSTDSIGYEITPKPGEYKTFSDIIDIIINLLKKMAGESAFTVSLIIYYPENGARSKMPIYKFLIPKRALIRALRKIQRELQNQE